MSTPRAASTVAAHPLRPPTDPYGWLAWLDDPRLAWARGPASVARLVWPWLLAAWFAWNSWNRIGFFVDRTFPLGIDATIYYRGSVAWLHGDDPWSAGVQVQGSTFHYAGTPVTTVLLAPLTVLGEQLFTLGWLAASLGAAVYIVWRLRLPWFWLLFPPLAEGLFSANPQLVVLALVLVSREPASAVATMLKVYAFVPLFGEGRWRQIALAVVANAATIVVAPALWQAWLGDSSVINGRLLNEAVGGFSAFGHWPLFAVALALLLVLALRDRRTAGWLAVPALWPATQFHYQTLAMPVMTPVLAVAFAYPMFQLPVYAILIDVALRLVGSLIASRYHVGREGRC